MDDQPKFQDWPLGVMREIESLREEMSDAEFASELDGLIAWMQHIIKGLRP